MFFIYICFFIGLFHFSFSTDIIGCGGFIKSDVPLDFSLINIRLYTKQETLKESSDCAPTNGYYFIPLNDLGEYSLRIEPPAGWHFEPKAVPITFNGVSDPCTSSKDINFHFKGFTVHGKVYTRGSLNGPKGVKVILKSETGQDISTSLTGIDGSFQLAGVFPGKYSITALHPSLTFVSNTATVVFSPKNLLVPPKLLVVAGFDIAGYVFSNGEPVKGVSIILYSTKGDNSGLPYECHNTVVKGAPPGALCHVITDATGTFRFIAVPSGQYIIRPRYDTFQVLPNEVNVDVEQSPVILTEKFLVKGFSVRGSVLTSPGGKGLAGVSVYLDNTAVTTTDKEGRFQLDRMEISVYDLSARSDDFRFNNLRVKISPTSPELEPLVAASVRVCGAVRPAPGSDGSHLEILAPGGAPVLLPVTSESGHFCHFLAPGRYSLSVLSDEGSTDMRYVPISKDITVTDSPIKDIVFSQLRATVRGSIKRLQGNAADKSISVQLKSRDDVEDSLTLGPKENNFAFTNVAPGTYDVKIESQLTCFDVDSYKVVIDSPNVTVPDFEQSGYNIRIKSSHQTSIDIKTLKRVHVKSATIERGENAVCVRSGGQLLIVPTGCHGYPQNEITCEAGQDSVLELLADSHDVAGFITTTTEIAPIKIHVHSNGQLLATLGPLQPRKFGDVYKHEFKYRVKDGQHVQFSPEAKLAVFTPEVSEVFGGSDCLADAVQLIGEVGVNVEGKIVPPLSGVSVTLKATTMELAQVTKGDGKFAFGPLKKSVKFELTAEKESYVMTGPDASNTFQAHKLAQVEVKVVENGTNTALPGVLLSLTGGEKYRKNSITENGGERTFHSLSPGEYFLRASMKEYKFDPVSVIIQLGAGESKTVTLTGRRVSFSVFGSITSLNGEPEEGVPVEVVSGSQDECLGHQEEGVSDAAGAFRIRGLLPTCTYGLQMKQDTKSAVYRVVPNKTIISTKNGDVENVRLIAFHNVDQVDVSVFVKATVPDHLKTITVKLYKQEQPDVPIHAVRLDTLAGGIKNWGNTASQERFLRGGLLVTLPFLSKDGTTYIATAESSLSQAGHSYTAPTAVFTADKPYRAVELLFEAKLKQIDPESSNHLLAGFFLGIAAIVYWQLQQGWPAVNVLMSWWAASSNPSSSPDSSAAKKKLRNRKT